MRSYYLISVLIIFVSLGIFFLRFEKNKPKARELVTISVMSAIAAISRAAFIMFPAFKPLVGITIISGISLGALPGFIVGALSGFVSNFLFGQGAWTPWQMLAFGIGGFLGGVLGRYKIIGPHKRVFTAIVGAAIIMLVIGPILDTCAVFTMFSEIDKAVIISTYIAGISYNAVHALAVFLTLFFLCKPICEKLERIKIKYGMMGAKDEI